MEDDNALKPIDDINNASDKPNDEDSNVVRGDAVDAGHEANSVTSPGETFSPGDSSSNSSHNEVGRLDSERDEAAATNTVSASTEDKAATPVPFNTASPAPKKSKKGIITGILFLVVLIIGAVGFVWWVNRDTADQQAATTPETQEIETLRIGTIEGPVNHFFPDETLGISYVLSRQIYEGLVGNDGDNYIPLLANSWTNPDERTWVFQLKQGVLFHTGKEFTATDVKQVIDLMQEDESTTFLTGTIASVETNGDYEVTIVTDEPDALLLNRLALIYMRDTDAIDERGANGTGPYKVDFEQEYSENKATFVAVDDYHQGRVKARQLVFTVYATDEENVEAFLRGENDIIENVFASEDEKKLFEGYTVIDYSTASSFGIYMNTLDDGSPLSNIKVREAIALAVDRQALVDQLDIDAVPLAQIIPRSLPGHDAETNFPERNLEAARQALIDAGFDSSLTLQFSYLDELQPDPPIVIGQLEEAGFTIERRTFADVGTFLDTVDEGDFQLFTAGYSSDLSDSRDILGAILETTEQTYPVYSNATYDKLLADSDREFDPVRRISILQQANRHVTENFAWIPLRGGTYSVYHKPDIDVKIDYNGGGSLGAYYWKVGRIVE